ncbi:hypothetical protein [Peteryoungia ipomoeae]|uniref:GGDEF domain-containing protein n=1 Tax=Peteryoungia ipomoeae TaxID=1210932 RepID=A0A4V4HN50_9HYPH|nr:hypothetical protein [Peteryoungia ipomoeae]THV24676.1 hypothetical protein FAA97_00205 [Peteryoungia ipomoeae]
MDKPVVVDSNLERLGARALRFLTQHRIPWKPIYYEVLLEVLEGRNTALRRAFVALEQPLTEDKLAGLAARFFPRFQDLNTLRASTESLEQALSTFCAQIGSSEILSLRDGQWHTFDRNLLDQAVSELSSALARTGNLLGAPTEENSPLPEAGVLTSQLPFDMQDFSALEHQLSALFEKGMPDQGVSLILCHLKGLASLRHPQASEAESYVRNTVGRFTNRLLHEDEGAFWTSQDEMGILMLATSEPYIEGVCSKIGKIIENVEGVVTRAMPNAPKFNHHFGCARTYRPVPPTHLYNTASKMLQRAELTEEAGPLFAEVSGQFSGKRYEALYGRHEP